MWDCLHDRYDGHRSTDENGVGRRRFRVEYRGRGLVGPALDFRTLSPVRFRDVCEGTPWSDVEVPHRGEFGYYRARLEK